MAIFADMTENECIIDSQVRDIDNTSPFTVRTLFNIIEMPFAPYGRAMLDARPVCRSWASCFICILMNEQINK